jgi:hypothetical protein
MKRRNKINEQFSARSIEMLESPAFRVLSRAARMVLDRIEIELAHHGGNDAAKLPVTKADFITYGIHHHAVAPAIRESVALGFARVIPGRGGNAEHRSPSLFFLTYANHCGNEPLTNDWRGIKTLEEAQAIADAARADKNPHAVRQGKTNWKRRGFSGPETGTETKTFPGAGFRGFSGPKTGPETGKFSGPETGTTGSGRKPAPLSISGVGGDFAPVVSPSHLDRATQHDGGPPSAEPDIIDLPAFLPRHNGRAP